MPLNNKGKVSPYKMKNSPINMGTAAKPSPVKGLPFLAPLFAWLGGGAAGAAGTAAATASGAAVGSAAAAKAATAGAIAAGKATATKVGVSAASTYANSAISKNVNKPKFYEKQGMDNDPFGGIKVRT
jgi:hypothetical protein